MPITLNANRFIGTISNLIVYTKYYDRFRYSSDVDDIINVFRSDDAINGDGIIVRTADLPPVVDLSETSTLLSVQKPTMTEQYLPIKEFKKIQLTINEYLMRSAFENEYALANLIGYLLDTMRTAKNLYLYSAILTDINNALANNYVKEVNLTGFAKITGSEATAVEDNARRTSNANLLYRTIIAQVKQLGIGGYSHEVGGGNKVVYDRPERIACIVSPEVYASLDVDSLATLLNSSIITKDIKFNFIVANIGTNAPQGSVVLVSKDAYQYGFFYQLSTSFFDASNLNTNHFLHFAWYGGAISEGFWEIIKMPNFFVE